MLQVSLAFTVPAHVSPHRPQSMSVSSGVSQPSTGARLQSSKPGSQPARRHSPATHAGLPLEKAQRLPHVLQLATSVLPLISQPVAREPSQSR